uniref:Uncharacterized protein n=1 Tax=Rhizobium rhizogenes TaxID=359 RepID=A0A7S5DQI7_RHIRH|nr:hypothetical protein pC6.5b_329 [Rhizobium rhizogenes]
MSWEMASIKILAMGRQAVRHICLGEVCVGATVIHCIS